VDISLFHSHLHILCGEEEKATDYVLKYLAHMVQCPGTLPRVALVFMSSQGVGKNIFFENFAKYILGQDLYLQTDNMEKIIGKFNMNYNKLMVIMDEVQTKDSFTNSEAIKNMITAETLLWERKGCDPITITNVARDIMFSNGLLPVKIECTDRRFMLMECKNTVRNNTEYFKRLYAFFKDDRNARAIYDMLMNVDLSAWDSTNDRVITKAYKDVQSATTPPMALFLETKLLEYEHYGSYDLGGQDAVDLTKFSSQELFQEFSAWLSQNGFTKMEYTITKYGREIVSYQGIEKKRLTCGITIVVDYKVLKAGLIEKGYHTPM
jgi:phage/plasmid-associated DNA primase